MTERPDDKQKKKKLFKTKKAKVLGIITIILFIICILGAVFFGFVYDSPKFCTVCHNMQPYYDTYSDSDFLVHAHATNEEEELVCHDCHHATIEEQANELIMYVTGDYYDPLYQRKFDDEFCLKCHDFEEVKELTAFEEGNPHDNHNDLDCNVCHKMHTESEVYCMNCHDFEWFEEVDGAYWLHNMEVEETE